MEHYIVKINDRTIGDWKMTDLGVFFSAKRWRVKSRAESFVKSLKNTKDDVKVLLYIKKEWKGTLVYDEVM